MQNVLAKACIDTIICTKGIANLRRDNDAVWTVGRAGGRVARHVASQEVPAIASDHLRRRPPRLSSRHDARNRAHRRLFLRALRPYVRRGTCFESQLGNSSRYVAGKTASRYRF